MINRLIAYVLSALCTAVVVACSTSEGTPPRELPGKIVYTTPPNEYFHYAHGILRHDSLREQPGQSPPFDLSWVGQTDTLLGKVYEYDPTAARKIERQKLMLYDSNGRSLNRILFETGPHESIGSFYASPDGLKLIVEVTRGYNSRHWNYTSGALQILDLKNGKPLQSIAFDSTVLMTVDEWPWSPDQTQLVYSARSWRHWHDTTHAGVYIYDLATQQQTRIDHKGWWAVWSPNGKYIAYIKHNTVWLYDVATRSSRTFYSSRSFEDLSVIHWSPNGEYLRIHGWKYVTFGSWFEKPFERMIRTSDGQEDNFKMIGGALYSWK
jgi:hypothetical protein